MNLDDQLDNIEGDDEILEAVKQLTAIVDEKLPNGEIHTIKERLDEAAENQRELCENVKDLHNTLVDPEDGLIVKVNENRSFIETIKKLSWTVFPIMLTTLMGIFVKLFFL